MNKEELKNMIETIPTEKWQYISGTRDIGKSYFQNLLDEKDKEIGKLVDELEEQERHIKEAKAEIERLNNIINELEKELFGMYVDIAGWNEDYAKKRIEKLKEGGDSENL